MSASIGKLSTICLLVEIVFAPSHGQADCISQFNASNCDIDKVSTYEKNNICHLYVNCIDRKGGFHTYRQDADYGDVAKLKNCNGILMVLDDNQLCPLDQALDNWTHSAASQTIYPPASSGMSNAKCTIVPDSNTYNGIWQARGGFWFTAQCKDASGKDWQSAYGFDLDDIKNLVNCNGTLQRKSDPCPCNTGQANNDYIASTPGGYWAQYSINQGDVEKGGNCNYSGDVSDPEVGIKWASFNFNQIDAGSIKYRIGEGSDFKNMRTTSQPQNKPAAPVAQNKPAAPVTQNKLSVPQTPNKVLKK